MLDLFTCCLLNWLLNLLPVFWIWALDYISDLFAVCIIKLHMAYFSSALQNVLLTEMNPADVTAAGHHCSWRWDSHCLPEAVCNCYRNCCRSNRANQQLCQLHMVSQFLWRLLKNSPVWWITVSVFLCQCDNSSSHQLDIYQAESIDCSLSRLHVKFRTLAAQSRWNDTTLCAVFWEGYVQWLSSSPWPFSWTTWRIIKLCFRQRNTSAIFIFR